ncbi:MAG: type II secretion system F family protein [Bilophila sp.]
MSGPRRSSPSPLWARSSRCRSWPASPLFSRSLQRSGVSILDSLDILSETINNAALEREFSTIKEKLRAGAGIAEPLSRARYFTPLTINMVAVGERAGNLETMLEDLAAHYDEEVEYAVGEMTEAIGPILIVVLAAVVGFFALAIFMPMWDMTKLAGGGT